MRVGVLGLGLIGGSMARCYNKASHTVYAIDVDASTNDFAQLSGIVQEDLNKRTIPKCDLIFLAIYPEGSAAWLEKNAHLISKSALVLDLCGIKQEICARCFPLAKKYGFTFVGGHPMAGNHLSGFKHSKSSLFRGAPMVLVPPVFDDIALLDRVTTALAPCGFTSYTVTTAEDHDRMIAFTSQIPHILSNGYIKSPTALKHKGFSAGSYKDLTRVAWLNAPMWAELCLYNRENVLYELDTYMATLQQYRETIAANDFGGLTALLEEGKRLKEEVDG